MRRVKSFREAIRKIKAFLTYLICFRSASFRTAPGVGEIDEISFVNAKEGGILLPRIIWLYWDDPDCPDYIDAMVQRVRALNAECDVRLLNRLTVSHYIDDYMLRQVGLSAAMQADLIRLELILRYGGIWLDATSLVFEDFSWIYEKFKHEKYNFVGYYAPWTRVKRFPLLETWLIASSSGDEFIRAWRDEFKQITALGVDGYLSVVKSSPDYGDIVQGIDNPRYFLVYLAGQRAMRQVSSLSVHLRNAGQSGLLYHELVHWLPYRIALTLCANRMPASPPPLIKITHAERYLVNIIWNFNLFSKNSYLALLRK